MTKKPGYGQKTVCPRGSIISITPLIRGDDWFISPEITIPATGTYLMRFVVTGASYGESLDVYMGNAATVEV